MNKICQCCGKRPVGKGRRTLCDVCAANSKRYEYVQMRRLIAQLVQLSSQLRVVLPPAEVQQAKCQTCPWKQIGRACTLPAAFCEMRKGDGRR